MNWLLRWIASAIALVITVSVGHAIGLHMSFSAHGAGLFVTAMLAAAIFGFVNAVVRPIIQLISLPITCLTLGAFSIVINAFLFWLTALFVPGFHVGGFIAALFGSVAMSLVANLVEMLMGANKPE
jgi:putative membrane protein